MGRFGAFSRGHGRLKSQQRGAVAVVVGLTLALMIGFAGLALDLGRLFINKTELQTAADACALAAARELICDTSVAGACPIQFLVNAEAAGMTAAARNNRDMQGQAVTIAPGDVRFSIDLNDNYRSLAGGPDTRSKFVMCTARSDGIVPWLMGVVGLGDANNVASSAVATLAPSQNFCLGPPIGVCSKGANNNFGYNLGEWIVSTFTSSSGGGGGNGNGNAEEDDVELTGGFVWVDFDPNAGGANEVRDGLLGVDGQCGISVDTEADIVESGVKQGVKSAYNSRFGIYPKTANSEYDRPDGAPPDRTGYAYPSQAPSPTVIGFNQSAYADYRAKQGSGTPFTSGQYDDNDADGSPKNANKLNANNKYIASSPEHLSFGSNRRLIAVPALDCSTGKVVGSMCVLMLNPMGDGSGEIYLEYRGNASLPSSPCAAFGSPGGPGSLGPLVPTLVQ